MKHFFIIIFFLVLGYSCSDEPVETVFFDLDMEKGVFISCEGNFMYGNGSLSFYNTQRKRVTNRLFYARNNVPPGDVVQSLARFGEFLYIVVNNSGKIYVVDSGTVEFRGVITGLSSPRYIHFISDEKAYVSDLHARYLTVINPLTFEITGKIGLEGHTSEQMAQVGGYVYVSSWSDEEKVLVIDSETDEMIDKIHVPSQPRDLELDKNGKIWVLSGGSYDTAPEGNSSPALSRVDPQTFTIEQIFRFDTATQPSGLEMNSTRDTLIYINGGLMKMGIDSRHLPESDFISAGNRLFYSLAVHSENDEIYLTDAIDYTQDALVYRYTRAGVPVDTFRVGINPSGFLFR